jgi:NodT family efflux transporter outer membrane factor (OMF) lipoprotein
MAKTFKYALPILLLALAGCAGKSASIDYSAVEVPAGFSFPSPEKNSSVQSREICEAPSPYHETDCKKWWQYFNDPALDYLMEMALASNLDIKVAAERVKKARALFQVAGGVGGVQLSLSGTGGSGRAYSTTAGTYRLSGVASYEIDLWDRLSATTEAARLESSATEEDLRALHISVSAELAELYYLAVERARQLDLAGLMNEAARERLALSKERYDHGLASAQELFVAREAQAVAEARIPKLEAENATAEYAVALLTGRAPGTGSDGAIAKLTGLTELPTLPSVPELLPSELVGQRPDLRAAQRRVEAADQTVAASIADRFPSFSLTGEYGGASSRLGRIVESPNLLWNLLVQAALPVLDGGRRKGVVAKNEAVRNEMLLKYQKSLLVAFKEVEEALERDRAAVTVLPLATARVEAAAGSLKVVTLKYRNGVGGYVDVLAERQRFYSAQSGMAEARRALLSARIGVIRALGGGLTNGYATAQGQESAGAQSTTR